MSYSTIGSPLHMHLEDSLLSVSGWISFSDDIDHWVKNRVPIEFQNLALAWIITGHNYVLDGHGSGGIYGNGQVWYDWAKDEGNKYGRPMSFAIINSTDVIVQSESSVLPQCIHENQNSRMRSIRADKQIGPLSSLSSGLLSS